MFQVRLGFLLATLLGLAILARTTAAGATKLLLHEMVGNGVEITPAHVRANLARIERTAPFLDGLFVRFDASFEVMTNRPLRHGDVAADVAPMQELSPRRLRHNFAMVFNDRPADLFDDWAGAVRNWGTLARAARDAGFVGIAFDNEEYFGSWTTYPADAAYPGRSLAAYQRQARLRGRQVMQAVVAEFPNVRIMHLHGPYLGEPKTDRFDRDDIVVDFAYAGQLAAPFFAGMVEAQGSRAKVIDGGEIYCLRTAAEFSAWYDWRRFGLASPGTDSDFILPAFRQRWRDTVGIAFGVYNQTPARCSDRPMTAAVFGTTLARALRQADEYVWMYLEEASLLPGGRPIGRGWREAIRRAKAGQPP